MNKSHHIYGLLSLNAITIFGNALTEVAIPWLILEISNSPALVALVMSVKILPIIMSTFFSAYVVDRFGAFRMSLLSDLVNFFAALLIPLAYHADLLSFVLLALLVMLSTMLDSPSRLAKDLMLAKQLASDEYDRVKINTINASLESLCDVLAPMFASLLIPILGTIGALYFDAVTFLVVAVGLVILRKYYRENDQVENGKHQAGELHPASYFWSGLRYLKQDKQLLAILVVNAIVNAVITPLLQVYLPFTAKVTFDSVITLGLLMTSFVIGTLVSKLIYFYIGSRFANQHIIFTGYAVLTLTLLTIPLVRAESLLFLHLFLIGLSIGFSAPVEVTHIQQCVPEVYFARTMTLFTSIRFLCVPVGFLCFGWMLETSWASWTPALMASFVAVSLLLFLSLTKKC